jgi:hypothetical protein
MDNLDEFERYVLFLDRESLNEVLGCLAVKDKINVNVDENGNASFSINKEGNIGISSINIVQEMITEVMMIQKKQLTTKKDSQEFHNLEFEKEKYYDAIDKITAIFDKYDYGDSYEQNKNNKMDTN